MHREETRKVEPAGSGARAVKEAERTRVEYTRTVLSAQEKKQRRDADAARYVETAIKAAGGSEAVRETIERRLEETDRRIAELTRFDPNLQEERDFLAAQHEAVKRVPDARRSSGRTTSTKSETVAQTEQLAVERTTGLFDRLKSGWGSLKARLFGGETAVKAAEAPRRLEMLSAYDRTWTTKRKARRLTDRQREVGAVKERATEALQDKLATDRKRLSDVSAILSRPRKNPIPSETRARYVAEVQRLKAGILESEQLLRIAEATSAKKAAILERQKEERRAA